jgi:hypothetical protein
MRDIAYEVRTPFQEDLFNEFYRQSLVKEKCVIRAEAYGARPGLLR